MHNYKSLLSLGNYKEDSYYIDLITGDLKKSIAHKVSESKIFLSSIIGYHILGIGLFKSVESNLLLSIYLLIVFFVEHLHIGVPSFHQKLELILLVHSFQ